MNPTICCRAIGIHTKIGVMKKMWYFIFIFAIVYFGIRKIHYGVVRQQWQLSRTAALPRLSCQCMFKYITHHARCA